MRKRRLAWVAALGLAAVGLQAPAANAAPPEDAAAMPKPAGASSGAPSSAPGAEHCAIGLTPTTSDAPAGDYRCFDTFAESIAYATGGALRLAADATTVTDSQLTAADARPSASTLVGVVYDRNGYSGSSLALYGSAGSCGQGTTYGFPNMGSYGWNNRISSARGYNNCVSTHYSGTSYNGSNRTCSPSCSAMGSLNNQTSSIRYW